MSQYKYTYDSLGNLVDVYQNDEHTTHNRYNALSWKLAEDNELDNKEETYAYTETGDVALYTDKTGNKHKYAYTPFYELEREEITSKSGDRLYSKENTYDTNSRQLKTESNSYGHSVSYDYDDFHRTTSFATQGKTYKIRHQANGQTNPYNINDLDDLVDEFTYSNDSSTRYRYDALGRLSILDGLLSGKIQYQYNTDYTGDSVSVSYPNGTSMTQQVNSFGEIIQTSHSDGWLERNNYDGFGNITEVRNNEGVSQYKYDKIDRIEEDASSHRAKDITYEYDELGNRKTAFAGDFMPSTEDRTQKYDALNRLTQVKQGDKTTDYTYYPNGLRATKKEGSDTTQYIYYNGQVIEELDGSGRSKAQNVFGNGLVFRKDGDSGKSGYYLFNSHGDVSKVVDARNGQVLNQYQYDIWGNPKKDGIQKEEMQNPFRYSGEILDAETGMYYLRARYYDPSVGRFISEDTYKGQVDNPLSLNRYTYVHNNPVNNIDPTGNWCESADGRWSHSGSCNSGDSTPGNDWEHDGDLIKENGRKVDVYEHDFSLGDDGGRFLEGFEDPLTYVTGIGGLARGFFKTLVKEGAEDLLTAASKSDALNAIKNLPDNIQTGVKSFFKGGSAKYSEFVVTRLSNGNYIVKMTKPGDVPGSKAIYYKEIGPNGNTLRVFKDTFDPKGNLVHTKNK